MSAISGAGSGSVRPPTTDAFSAMTSEQFAEIIFAELSSQDPLAPNETSDLIDQVSALQQMESDRALTEELQSLVSQNEVTAASAMIGKIVTGLTQSNERSAGFVDSVSVTREGSVLNLNNGTRIPFENVEEVIDPSLFDDSDEDESEDEAGGVDDGAEPPDITPDETGDEEDEETGGEG